jgi:hypothetical protein
MSPLCFLPQLSAPVQAWSIPSWLLLLLRASFGNGGSRHTNPRSFDLFNVW